MDRRFYFWHRVKRSRWFMVPTTWWRLIDRVQGQLPVNLGGKLFQQAVLFTATQMADILTADTGTDILCHKTDFVLEMLLIINASRLMKVN